MRHTASLVAVLILVGCACANAGPIVFSNFGQPGDTYGPDGLSFGANPFLPPQSTTGIVATRFHVNSNSTMDGVETPLQLYSGPSDFYGYLLSEVRGVPDHVLEAVHFTTIAASPSSLTIIVFPSNDLLLANTPYWFGLSAGPSTFANWLLTPFYGDAGGSPDLGIGQISGDTTSGWTLGTGGPLGREGAFRVTGTDIPEPGYGLAVLILSCLCCLGGRSRAERS